MPDPVDTQREAAAGAAASEAPVEDAQDRQPPHGDPLAPHGEPEPVEQAEEAAAAEAPEDPLAAAEARAQEYLELAQRKQAEFENFRRRMTQKAAEAEDRGVAKVVKELLPALDHLDMALEAAEQHAGGEDWVKGIRLVQDEVAAALGRVGVEPFSPLGEEFDPNEHDAMAQQPAAGGQEPGTVTQVYQQGYKLNGTVLRAARVIVAG